MNFEKLVEIYMQLEKTASGNEMRQILAEFFKSVPKDDIHIVAYLTLGKLGAEYEDVVLGLAEKSVVKAIAKAAGVSEAKVKELVDKRGDAGLAAEDLLKKKPMTLVPVGELTIHEFFEKLHKIANTDGSGSQDTKANILVSLLQKTSAAGARYLIRIVLGQLRMGVAEMTVLDALAIAYTGEKKNKEILEYAYNISPDVGIIAETIAKNGLKGFDHFSVQVGRPVKMMLAQRVEELEEISKKIECEMIVEGKYDGERVQAHKLSDGKIILFSRRLDTITDQFPDLVEYLGKYVKAKTFVLEGEILAIDAEGNPLPFQTLMQRRRKYDVAEYVSKIPIQLKVFDLLYVDGVSYLDKPLVDREKKTKQMISSSGQVVVAERIVTSSIDEVEEFFQKMLERGYEGIIVKNPQGEYQAGTRGWNWIKWKKDYVKELSDTFDLVVLGAYIGRGRRHGTYGALLGGIYDEKNDEFLSFCKIGTGLNDEMLAELPTRFKEYVVGKKPARVKVEKIMEPDVWFSPEIVVEVSGAEITQSPSHTAGVALRFPRFLRYREKSAEQATTVKEVKGMMGK